MRSACTPPLLARVCGVGVCASARISAAPLPLLAGVCGVGVCGWARVLAAPRHSWLGCWGSLCACVCAPLVPRHSWLGCVVWLCVLGLEFRLRPATPGWGVGVLSVLVWGLGLQPATPGWGARFGCVCLGSGFGCAPPLLAGVLGCVCARVRAPLVPRHSWLGCAVWVCVFGLGFRLRPATPGWGVGVCVCWCACSSCTLPLLAGVCIVVVCARARVLAAPRHSWLGFVVCGSAVAWQLFLCRGSLRVVRAFPVCRPRRPSLLGTRPCALVVAGGVPLWRASWPRVVRRAASGPVAFGAPVGLRDAVVPFPTTGACAPGFARWLRGARTGRPRTGFIVPAAGPRRGRGAGLAPRRTRSGPRVWVVPVWSLRRWSSAACAAVVGVCGPGH